MADFMQTMKDWRRMCKDRSCGGCILKGSCDIDPDSWTDDDIRMIETNVKIWAAEHPEPVYPTWGEWFVSTGLLPDKWDGLTSAYIYVGCVPNLLHSPIPADIAQKLGIEPEKNA